MGLEEYMGDMGKCHRCSACKFVPLQMVKGFRHANVCPSISRYNFHSYSGGGKLKIAAAILQQEIDYSEKLLDVVYNCQMCGACSISCNYAMDMKVIEPIQELRIKCVADGRTNPALENAISTLRQQGSMIPAGGNRGDWAAELNLDDAASEQADLLYHAGCLSSYDKEMQKLPRAIVKILQEAGVRFGIAGNSEMCCGGRAYQMGYEADFINQAKKNISMIERSGVKTILTGCADCYHTFKVLYPKYKLKSDLEVLHITEYVAKLIHDGRLILRKKIDIAVTYHDPCRLGRLGEPWIHWEGKKIPGGRFVFDPPRVYRRGTYGIYDPPRQVLNSIPGIRLMEMDRIKEYSWCCGAGGGVNESNPQYALWTAQERVSEAVSAGASAMVTACPWCGKIFNKAIKESGRDLKVYDMVELVEESI